MPEIDSTRSADKLHLSRRAVVGTVAWGAPSILVASAVPAFAASTTMLAATFNADSFRTNSNANFTAGVPSNGTTAIAIRIDLAVTGGTLSNLSATLNSLAAAPNGVTIYNNTVAGNRGTTTWPVGQGALSEDGWTVTPAVSNTQTKTFVFSQASGSFAGGRLRFVIGGFSASGANSDFPATVEFDADELANPVIVVFDTPNASPFVSEVVI